MKNTLAKESEFYIFSDAAKTENGVEKVNEVRKFIQDNSWHTGFKKVSIVEAEKNKGLAKSIIGGVSDIIQKYGKVIVLEDDLKLSPYFLEYMNDALEYYREDEKIWSISGYSFPMKSLKFENICLPIIPTGSVIPIKSSMLYDCGIACRTSSPLLL